jgi:hypothetical protein
LAGVGLTSLEKLHPIIPELREGFVCPPQIGKARIFIFYVEEVARRFPNAKAKVGARTAITVERNGARP